MGVVVTKNDEIKVWFSSARDSDENELSVSEGVASLLLPLAEPFLLYLR